MCELCNLEKKTKWYYEDKDFIICDCETCKIPMVVPKEHADAATSLTKVYIAGLVTGVFKKSFHFRTEPRKVKDHWHWHIIFGE